jgi:hypothetical protein
MSEKKSKRENGRFSVKRKSEAILRLLRGEDLELLSWEYGVTAARLNQWRADFLSAGHLKQYRDFLWMEDKPLTGR